MSWARLTSAFSILTFVPEFLDFSGFAELCNDLPILIRLAAPPCGMLYTGCSRMFRPGGFLGKCGSAFPDEVRTGYKTPSARKIAE
jgi:hypothetical protein